MAEVFTDFRVAGVRELLPLGVERLELSPIICHYLKCANVTTLWALVQVTESQLLSIPGITLESLGKIEDAMAKLHLRPGMRKKLIPRYPLAQRLARQGVKAVPQLGIGTGLPEQPVGIAFDY